MKKVTELMAVIFFIFANTLFAQEQVSKFEKGEVGYFQFPFSSYNSGFALWPTLQLTGGSLLSGKITKKTVIRIANKKFNVNLDNLDLLTGKKVFVYGRFRQVGEGEGSYYHTDFLVIYILSDGESRGR